uniref:RNA helicase n=2 Tax=Parascaris univalens TaxID=6257 RepID=A0A914ZSV2_PARUN
MVVVDEKMNGEVVDTKPQVETLNWKIGFRNLLAENAAFRAGHYRLYKHELMKAAFASKEDLLKLKTSFEEAKLTELNKISEDNLEEFAEIIWESMCEDPDEMDKLMTFASGRDHSLWDLINEEILSDSLEYYVMFFVGDPMKMDMITKTLEPIPLCDRLFQSGYESVVKKVRELMVNKLYDQASCYLMRSLPRVTKKGCDPSEWYFDFLDACRNDSANRTIPEFVDPDYRVHMEIHSVKRRMGKTAIAETEVDKSDNESTMVAVVDEFEETSNRPCRPQERYKKYRIKTFTDEHLALVQDPEPIELRPYQEELVEAACRGVNTIICAPTGSGKTIVATYIIRSHLQEKKDAGETARVAMLVPTVPLVEQQSLALNRYLRKVFWVEGLCGSERVDEDGRAPFVLASHVTIFTPQIFINLLRSIRRDDRLYFNDFTMLVFDECHHCDGDHPYHVLMRMLHDHNGKKPQVVGLTASLPLGSGRANVEAALDHMMDLCAKLSAYSISTVRKHLRNLQEHVTPPIDEVRNARRPQRNMFVLAVQNCMTKIETHVRPELENLRETLQLRLDETNFPPHTENRYESFIGSLKSRITTDMPGGSVKYQLIKMLDHLGFYYRALTLSDVLPDKFAYDYLAKKIRNEATASDARGASIQKELRHLFEAYVKVRDLDLSDDDNGESKEIIRLLHEILLKQYEKEPSSRTIIFVTTRMLAEKLAEHLNECRIVDGGPRAIGFVTSSNQSSSFSGQTAAEQRLMIEDFNTGLRKVLVATSVAEEGLDISACNLIIKYNNTGSERSLIQRRGRARAKNSRSILLALDGSIEKRELENIQKEELMRLCLRHIQTKSEEQMKNLVHEKIREHKALRETALAQRKERRALLAERSFDLCCRMCGAFICKSSDMRVACENQYVCCDPTIWERIEPRVHSSSKAISIATLVGKPYCKGTESCECNEAIGTIIRLYGAFLPTISARAIVVDDKDEPGRMRDEKKWETISREKFFIEPITERDLKVMLAALLNYSKEMHCVLEAEVQMVAERAVADAKRERKHVIKYTIDD